MTHDRFESADLLFLSYHTSPSTTPSTDRFGRVFTVYDTFHDSAEESNTSSVGDDGAVRIVISRVESDSLTS
jgi:hypothetical protein